MIKKFTKQQIEKFENRNQLSQEQKNKLKQLEDEFALQIEWFPKEESSTSFTNHKLIQVDNSTIKIMPSTQVYLFIVLFLVIPGLFFYGSMTSSENSLGLFVIGLMFLVFVAIIGYSIFKRAIFDKNRGLYTELRLMDSYPTHKEKKKVEFPLNTIYSIQAIKRTTPDRHTFYELYFVFQDKKRKRFISNQNKQRTFEDARIVSEFLGVPFWDGTKL